MFHFCQDTFGDSRQQRLLDYWSRYAGKEISDLWGFTDMMIPIARGKNDRAMTAYLEHLDLYLDISNSISSDAWEYPTPRQLQERKRNLTSIVSACQEGKKGRLAQQWMLLEMRANMLLGNHNANVALWNNQGKKSAPGVFRDMMENVYANALLNTGKKREAWEIYAGQNDQESLLWSVRKFRNLAGLKQIYAEDPNAKVLGYLLQNYVNDLQDVLDCYSAGDTWSNIKEIHDISPGEAYATVDEDFLKEARDFTAFAKGVAEGGKTKEPCLWMAASALVSYFLMDYDPAYRTIEKALAMNGSEDTKNMARRIRMLLKPAVSDLNAKDFKEFMAGELKWLDEDIRQTDYYWSKTARDRILNLGLAQGYINSGDPLLARYIVAYRECCNPWYSAFGTRKCNSDYSSNAFQGIWELPSSEMTAYFEGLKQPTDDPLKKYVCSVLEYSDDYVNDLIGTRLLSEGKFEAALPYLSKVSLSFLSSQNIAPYAALRTYKKPCWFGQQRVEWEKLDRDYTLMRNIKIDFCRDVMKLQNEYAKAEQSRRLEIGLELAGYLFQASQRGQCWFLTDYSWSPTPDDYPICKFDKQADNYLMEAVGSWNPLVKSMAMFASTMTAPDNWRGEEYDYSKCRYVIKIDRYTESYSRMARLHNYLKGLPGSPAPEISKCDVYKTWRKYAI